MVGTTGLVRSTKCDGIAGSRHLICVRSSRRTATASAVTVTGSAVRRAAAPPHRGLLRTAKSRGTNLGFFGGNNWTRKDERSEDGIANGKANAQTGEMRGIRTNGAVRRSVNENSYGNSARRLSVSVSSDEVTGSAVRRAAVPPHRGLLRTAKSRGDKPRLLWWKQLDSNQ